MKTLIVIASIMLMVIGLGCAALSSYVTPAEVDQNALRYAINAGIVELDDYDAWYPNLAEAERLAKNVDAAHNTVQLSLQQQAQKDNLDYSIHKDVVSTNLIVANQREEMLFGETGLMSLGLSMAGFGGLTGLLGLMRRRPGDITKPEMEQALATATGKTTAELSLKEKQMIQLVKGIQAFMDTYETSSVPGIVKDLKNMLDKAQDKDTQAAVAVIKKTV